MSNLGVKTVFLGHLFLRGVLWLSWFLAQNFIDIQRIQRELYDLFNTIYSVGQLITQNVVSRIKSKFIAFRSLDVLKSGIVSASENDQFKDLLFTEDNPLQISMALYLIFMAKDKVSFL